MLKRILPMALVSALCVALAIYVTAPKAPAGGEGATGTYTASAKGFQSDVTVTVTFDKGTITDVTVDSSGETANFGLDQADALAQQVKDANGGEIDGVSGVTFTSDAVKTAMEEIMAQAGSAGGSATYTATAKGFQSDVTVTVTFDGDTITDVVVDSSGETANFGLDQADALAQQVKEANGGEIDGVSGVTFTSDAVKAALADIMAQKG